MEYSLAAADQGVLTAQAIFFTTQDKSTSEKTKPGGHRIATLKTVQRDLYDRG